MTAEEIIAKVPDLPVVSETARQLTIQLSQPDLHRDDLVDTLRCDNVLTAKVLRLCNSAETGLSEPVDSVDHALLLLGNDAIYRMVCAIGYGSCLKSAGPGNDTEINGLWSHSLRTAVGAEYLSKTESYGTYPAPTAFTAGLLHDIGKVVMYKVMTPKDQAAIRSRMMVTASWLEAERAVLGADHTEVGVCLLRRWSLPELILEAVANHHSPVTTPEIQLSAVIYLANCAAHLAAISPEWETESNPEINEAALMLGIGVANVEQSIAGLNGAMLTCAQLNAAA